jgi:tRNA pseudouridine32 synthase/23S rRNA pseudouridine746 synthase
MSHGAGDTLRLLFVDDCLLVLDKPAGLLAVPGRGADKQDCLSARVQARHADALVVHRLDMATSGLMLMARGAAMQRALSMAFAARRIQKRYVAVVDGTPNADTDAGWNRIDLSIRPDWPNRPRRIVDAVRGKPSLTLWRTRPQAGDAADTTRLELEPVTGRSHQLRVHLAAIGHPILGDVLYAPPAVQTRATRLLLHATSLAFEHPMSGDSMTFTSPAPF